MFFTVEELSKWVGITAYELFILSLSAAVWGVMLSLKLDFNNEISWFWVFTPLFAGDAVMAYFNIIVAIRLYLERKIRPCLFKLCWSFVFLFLTFLFQLFLCYRLDDPKSFDINELLAPLFVLAQLIMFKACQLH